MKKISLLLILSIFSFTAIIAQQKTYIDSIKAFQKAYVDSHEVVKLADKKFIGFYKPSVNFRVTATVTKLTDTTGFVMKTSGTINKKYFRYAILHFNIGKLSYQLTAYQSDQLMMTDQYKDYLFIPFTDLTSGETSYGGGRYMDILLGDIKNDRVTLDFNKAYNPYCAYTTGYNCPIPPRENNLSVAIKSGESAFKKPSIAH